jgi:hyperosmotically inducible protein
MRVKPKAAQRLAASNGRMRNFSARTGFQQAPARVIVRTNQEGDSMKAKLITAVSILLFAGISLAQDRVPAKAAERIQREVRHELLMLPYFTVFDNLTYEVNGYDVTLRGQVTRPILKSDAQNAVKGIEGVEKIDNQIEVLPLSPMDDGLRMRLYRAIYGFPSLQRYSMGVQQPIRIVVKNGHVTLEGVVDSEADKDVAGIQANSVPGIFSVTNNLRVTKS